MCGIFGQFKEGGLDLRDLHQAIQGIRALGHRGPDGEGVLLISTRTGQFWQVKTDHTPEGAPFQIHPDQYEPLSADLFFAHRRLSILDLSLNGHQPMRDPAGNWLIFNGEVYNFLEIRERLAGLGHSFHSGTDSEVILAAWRQWGEQAFSHFNGMWALAIWDASTQKLILSGDRFGVKPLYYFQTEQSFVFASEIKALQKIATFPRDLNQGNIMDFLEDGTTDHNFGTFFTHVHRFPWGHFATITHPGAPLRLQPYWSFPAEVRHDLSYEAACQELHDLIYSAVSLRMRSDVDWGTSLSGGLDSSTIAYVADDLLHKKMGIDRPLYCFSAIFPGNEGDESEHIHFIEKDINLLARYTNPMENFTMEEFERHIFHQDFPVATTSFFAEWAVMKLTSTNKVKVLLDGQGADELFAGYHHHFYRYLRELALRGKWGLLRKEMRQYEQLKGMPTGTLNSLLRGEIKQFARLKWKGGTGPRHVWNAGGRMRDSLDADFGHLTLPSYLRSEDRDSMAFGVETRTPFLDFRIVAFARQIPPEYKIRMGWQKAILRDSMKILPDRIRLRKDKKGYTTPHSFWLKTHSESLSGALEYAGRLPLNVPFRPDLARLAFSEGKGDRSFREAALGIWAKAFLQS